MSLGFFKDSQGNNSSKRLCGAVLIVLGILLSVFLFFYSMFKLPADARTALDIINVLLISGGGLLGIGVFEKLKKS